MPTYENLSEFAEKELAEEFEDGAHLIAPAMTDEFSRHYERLFNHAKTEELRR